MVSKPPPRKPPKRNYPSSKKAPAKIPKGGPKEPKLPDLPMPPLLQGVQKYGNPLYNPGTKGPPPLWATPLSMVEDMTTYVRWAYDNPIIEERSELTKDGDVIRWDVSHPRALSIEAFCVFFGKSRMAFHVAEEKPGFDQAAAWCRQLIFSGNFELAVAGQMDSGLIARQLGLSDKKEVTSPDGSMTPTTTIDMSKMSKVAKQELLDAMLEAGNTIEGEVE